MTRPTQSRMVLRSPQSVAARLQRLCPLRPTLGLVLGSGFQHALSRLEVVAETPYRSIPGFPPVSVNGHAGKLVFGRLGALPVLVLSGRAHYYEGLSMAAITFPVRVLAALGIRHLLLTNAAGGINPRFRPGDFMSLSDHINLLPANPLCGPVPPGCQRFVDMTRTYDPGLNRLLRRAAKSIPVRLHTGVYLAVAGPCYETPAEIRAFARLGADAVGMSTVPEAIVARQCGLAVAGLSCITNLAAGRGKVPLSHAEVLRVSERVEESAAELLQRFLELYAEQQ